jgi:hypothetical protein
LRLVKHILSLHSEPFSLGIRVGYILCGHGAADKSLQAEEGRSFNPDEFAIALEQVVSGTAPLDYRDPGRFFARTCFKWVGISILSQIEFLVFPNITPPGPPGFPAVLR